MAIQGVKIDTSILVNAIKKAGGNVRRAAALVGCSIECIHLRRKKEPEIEEAIQKCRSQFRLDLVDLAEDKLVDKIQEGDMTGIIFTLKTQGRKMGYSQSEMEAAERILNLIHRGTMDRVTQEATSSPK